MKKSLYDILGVPPSATIDEIKHAFRVLAKETHPDVNGNNPEASKRFTEVLEAYTILSNPQKKEEYDRNLNSSRTFTTATQKDKIEEIKKFVEEIYKELKPYQDQAVSYAIKGSLWFLGGSLVTLLSGGVVIAWGAMLYGFIAAIQGFYKSWQIKNYIKTVENKMFADIDRYCC